MFSSPSQQGGISLVVDLFKKEGKFEITSMGGVSKFGGWTEGHSERTTSATGDGFSDSPVEVFWDDYFFFYIETRY